VNFSISQTSEITITGVDKNASQNDIETVLWCTNYPTIT